MSYVNQSVSKFLEELSSRNPVPGGGSAAALSGALGASLVSMTLHLTRSRKKGEGQRRLTRLLSETKRVRRHLVRLVDEDVARYLEVSRAWRKAKGSAERRPAENRMKPALRKALESSLDICRVTHRGLTLATRLLPFANQSLQSDARAACYLFHAGFRAAEGISRANAAWLKERHTSRRTAKHLSVLRRDVERMMRDAR